jgi:UDP-galactopyranose mutase
MKYDYLIVGAGLFGAVCAHELAKAGKKSLVIDRRSHIGGNIYTEEIEGIQVHKYGAHIFHTKNKAVWDFINQFAQFNHYRHTVIANYQGEIYNLPFNMNTFNRMWGVVTPEEVRKQIEGQKGNVQPRNLEEQAINLVGVDIYEKLIRLYTEKQWGRSCRELPPSIIRRLPVRFTYNNDYFDDPYQGIPVGGYTKMIEGMLDGTPAQLNTEYYAAMAEDAGKVIYTGPIDEYFGYTLGALEYRSLKFETEILEKENYQGCSVMNYTGTEPFTRIIEHKHFEFSLQTTNVITREYPASWRLGDEPYYPINDERNNRLYEAYKGLAAKDSKVIFGGRLGSYRYLDMDQVVENAMNCVEKVLQQ